MTVTTITYPSDAHCVSLLRNGSVRTTGLALDSYGGLAVLRALDSRGNIAKGAIHIPTDPDTLHEIAWFFRDLATQLEEKRLLDGGAANHNAWREGVNATDGELEVDADCPVSISSKGAYVQSWVYVAQSDVTPAAIDLTVEGVAGHTPASGSTERYTVEIALFDKAICEDPEDPDDGGITECVVTVNAQSPEAAKSAACAGFLLNVPLGTEVGVEVGDALSIPAVSAA